MNLVLFSFRVVMAMLLFALGFVRLYESGLVWQVFMSFGLGIANLINPLVIIHKYIEGQIALHRERQGRRRKYEQFQADIKSGLIAADDFEVEARGVVE